VVKFQKSRRVVILIFLISCALVERSYEFYHLLFRPQSLLITLGFKPVLRTGGIYIESINSRDLSGNLNPAFESGLRHGDQIVSMAPSEGEPRKIHGLFDIGQVLNRAEVREPLSIEVSRTSPSGSPQLIVVTLPRDGRNPAGYFILWLLGIIFPAMAIMTSAFVGLMKPDDDNAFIASLLFLSISSQLAPSVWTAPPILRELFVIFEVTLSTFVLYLLMRFCLLFPSPSRIDQKFPKLKTIWLWLWTGLWLYLLARNLTESEPLEPLQGVLGRLSSFSWIGKFAFISTLLISLASLLLNTIEAKRKDEKRRMVLLLAGTLIAFLPATVLAIYYAFTGAFPKSQWIFIAIPAGVGIFPLTFIYVVVKHRVLGIRLILRRGIQYALVSKGFLVIEGAAIFLILFLVVSPLYRDFLPMAGPGMVAFSSSIVTLGAVAALRNLNRRVVPIIDRKFFRENYNAQQVLTDLRRAVRGMAANPDQLLSTVTDKISDSLYLTQVAVFLRDDFPSTLEARQRKSTINDFPKSNSPSADYRSRCVRIRTGQTESSICAIHGEEGLRLSATSYLAQALDRFRFQEPVALEVYLDDPKSWLYALSKSSIAGEEIHQEKVLLESVNARLIVPLVTNNRVLGFLSLGEKLSEEPYSKADKELLLTVAEQTAIALDYALLILQVTEQEKFKRELEIAKDVQTQLFPQSFPALKTLEYSGICQAAQGVGGDYYDFLMLGTDKLGIAVGDISGKGISAALLMASLQALLRSHAPSQLQEINFLISEVNRLMCSSTNLSKFATFFYGLYDDSCRTLTYVNAGHNPPMIVRREKPLAKAQRIAAVSSPSETLAVAVPGSEQFTVIRLESGGTVLGFFPDATYAQETVALEEGDVLVVFTDGVSEAVNGNQEEFGEDRLANLIQQNLHRSAAEIQQLVLQDVSLFTGNAALEDDLTIVVAKVVQGAVN
jgi:sigma-B regulation protein RsbU (phosphoserine phosphatase)